MGHLVSSAGGPDTRRDRLAPSTSPSDDDLLADDGTVPLGGGVGGGGELGFADYSVLLAESLEGVDDAGLLVATCDALLDHSADYTSYVDAFVACANSRPGLDMFFVGDLPPQRSAGTATLATTRTLDAFDDISDEHLRRALLALRGGRRRRRGRSRLDYHAAPSVFVAGVFARTDEQRGVWKAPAGTEAALPVTVDIEHRLDDQHCGELNSVGVNALRSIPGVGRVVWGSRTMQPIGEWRHVPVRRTAIFLRTSVYNGIQWAVFEPNDEALWSRLRASIAGFMETQFRRGAFAGRTSDQAYLVKVGAETTTSGDQAAGVVNIMVGFAPLRPAEFVVIKFSQKTQPTP